VLYASPYALVFASRLTRSTSYTFTGEVGKVLGAQWKSLSDAQKAVSPKILSLPANHTLLTGPSLCVSQPYIKQADQDKIRAADQMSAYKSGGSAAAPAKKPASKKGAKAAPA
jgi:hypothetical protein